LAIVTSQALCQLFKLAHDYVIYEKRRTTHTQALGILYEQKRRPQTCIGQFPLIGFPEIKRKLHIGHAQIAAQVEKGVDCIQSVIQSEYNILDLHGIAIRRDINIAAQVLRDPRKAVHALHRLICFRVCRIKADVDAAFAVGQNVRYRRGVPQGIGMNLLLESLVHDPAACFLKLPEYARLAPAPTEKTVFAQNLLLPQAFQGGQDGIALGGLLPERTIYAPAVAQVPVLIHGHCAERDV